MSLSRYTVAASVVAVAVIAGATGASAQDPGSVDVGNATLKVGAGTAKIFLPDVDFFTTTNGAGVTLQNLESNDADDDYGFSVNGELLIPTRGRSSWSDSIALRGFYASVESEDNRSCTSSATAFCSFKPLVNAPTTAVIQAGAAQTLTSNSDREIEFWGAAVEARRHVGGYAGLKDGSAHKPGYFAFGADVRGIEQDTDINGNFVQQAITVTYTEDLDTHYYGVYAAFGRDYDLPVFRNARSGLGLQSSFRVWGGIYYADAEYRGAFVGNNFGNVLNAQTLSLSEDDVAFIGGITLETRKQLGPRTSISLKSDYEYYSWVPEMAFNDGAAQLALGPNAVTRIDNDDAFSTRTTLNLKFTLGPRDVVQPYK